MRLKITKSKNSTSFYIIKDVKRNGKRTTKIIEALGNLEHIKELSKGKDPYIWLNQYVQNLNQQEKENTRKLLIPKAQNKLIEKNKQNLFNCGYLFLDKIYHQLGLSQICNDICNKYRFKYDFDNILSSLIYGRIIFPSSKLATLELSKKFIEQPNFELQHIYRALEVISKETDFIQAQVYQNSKSVIDRNSSILYYDCTNYFFEIEQESGLRQYGPSKEHRPTPIVQMGLFMDGNGIPLAFNISSGNTNEQQTMTPTEQKILDDFKLSKFIVCTDAGLASYDNRKFNDKDDRAFITTQSIKKLKKHLKDWALSPDNWHISGDKKIYNINNLNDEEFYKDKIFYKERWINENGLEQKLIVTFSLKYRNYQRRIRENQIERAIKCINNKSFKLEKHNPTDFKRFIKRTSVTSDGEIANKKVLTLDKNVIEKEEQFDGFYGVCTNLDDDAQEIIKINQRRWEIEESFRIMKTEFKARPVYLSRDDRIKAHFTTCFLSLLIHRILEKKLEEKYTCEEIIDCLRDMNLGKEAGEGYIPMYTRTDLTDLLHDKFNFRTDYEIINLKEMKKILNNLKK